MEGDWYLCQAAIAVDGEDVKVQMKDQDFLLYQERDNTTGGSSTGGTHTAGMTGEESCLEWRGLGGYYTKVSSN